MFIWFSATPALTQEWAAKALDICIVVMTGLVQRGAQSTMVFNRREGPQTEVWLWQHFSRDGEGHAMPHYSLISQALFTDNLT